MSTKERITMARRVLPSGTIVVEGRRYYSRRLIPYRTKVVQVGKASTGLTVFDDSGRLICEGLKPEQFFEMSNTTRRPEESEVFFRANPSAY